MKESKIKTYDLRMEILYVVKGASFNERDERRVERINAFLREFREKIETLKAEEGSFTARVQRVDEFSRELVDMNTLLCSNHVLWTCWDSREAWADNKNINVGPWLHKLVRSVSMDNGLEYADKLEIKVVDSIFQGEYKYGHWPPENVLFVGF
jgi:hypothetical protein